MQRTQMLRLGNTNDFIRRNLQRKEEGLRKQNERERERERERQREKERKKERGERK